MSAYQKIGLVGCVLMVLLGGLALLPPEDTHAHLAGPHDTLEKIPPDERSDLEQLAEPVGQFWRFVMPDVASAHHPFPKVCANYDFVKPNHYYYLERHYWSGGYHYHAGLMDHAVGADYRFKFRCGGPGGHYKKLPQGWF